jgi:hypothetical protein
MSTVTLTSTPTVLTKDHIQFIRRRTKSVVFRYSYDRQTIEFQNDIGAELILEASFQYRGYGNSKTGSPERTPIKAFAMIHTPSFDRAWQTVSELLKPGDTFEVSWLADTNGYVSKATFGGDADCDAFSSLHLDQVELVVVRGKKRMLFRLGLSVCPSNSARMFQY